MQPAPVLIVDDEPDICQLVQITLERLGLATMAVGTLADAKWQLANCNFSMCLTDMRLPDGDGLDLLSHISETFPDTPVAMITAHGNMDIAINALKRGAFDFLTKPIDLEQLKTIVKAAVSMAPKLEQADSKILEHRLVGVSPSIKKLRETIVKIARSQAPVFIRGESGVGKEVCARCIHELSGRKREAFVAVNCGAIPAELVESEFFGHVKGSFTGADKDKKGLFASADHGSLLLDEIADLPLAMQVKLLRAIQEKSIRPVGSNEEFNTDIRLLSATHKNLQQLIAKGIFRDDLYYRINVIELNVPPLRDRIEDIPMLAASILAKLSPSEKTRVQLTQAAIDRLSEHTFPGNIRELENTLERSVALGDRNELDANDLIFQHAAMSSAGTPSKTGLDEDALSSDLPKEVSNIAAARTKPLDDFLGEIERREIVNALESCRWNRTEAAKALGISFRSLRYRLKKLGLED